MVSLLALDLDGTLIDHRLVIRQPVRAAVRKAMAEGVGVTLATGRMFVASLPYVRALEVQLPIVCYQGAAVYDVLTERAIRETPLARDVALRVVERAKRDGYHAQLYHDDRFYVEEDNLYAELYAKLAGVRPIVVPSLAEEFANRDSTKCNIVTEPERVARYIETVAAVCGDEAYVTRSNPEFIEVMDPRVDKGEALRFIAGRIGVPMGEVLAIGDSFNDIPLLRAAGFGIAMGSSPPQLQEVADAVVGDYAHDGVAEAIERYVLASRAAPRSVAL
ncbi:MAG: HAD family hydrolase [Candidatus Eremiobacteraeota bacterium]|nr:HAD family hydrolase [Candidatus Eremiobacteraeota bacterium]